MRSLGKVFLIVSIFVSSSYPYRTTDMNTSFRKMSFTVDGLEFKVLENYISDYDREYNRNTDVYMKIGRLNVTAGPTDVEFRDGSRRRESAEMDLSGYSATASGIEFGIIENGRDFKLALGSGSARITELEFEAGNDDYSRDDIVVNKVRGTLTLSNFNLGMNSRFIRDNMDDDAIDYFDILNSFLMRSFRYDFSYDRSKGPAILKLSSQSELANIDITGSFDYREGDVESSSINSLVIKVSRISPEMERLIADFERNSGARLDRVNKDIVIEISGSPESPTIKGIRFPDRGEERLVPEQSLENSYASEDTKILDDKGFYEAMDAMEEQLDEVLEQGKEVFEEGEKKIEVCELDKLADEYETLAEKLKKAMSSSDLDAIMSINQDVAGLLKKWERASGDNFKNCSLQEVTFETNRMQAIALSLME